MVQVLFYFENLFKTAKERRCKSKDDRKVQLILNVFKNFDLFLGKMPQNVSEIGKLVCFRLSIWQCISMRYMYFANYYVWVHLRV